jgi:hypothetical protein
MKFVQLTIDGAEVVKFGTKYHLGVFFGTKSEESPYFGTD